MTNIYLSPCRKSLHENHRTAELQSTVRNLEVNLQERDRVMSEVKFDDFDSFMSIHEYFVCLQVSFW